jgi:hypothetical protein
MLESAFTLDSTFCRSSLTLSASNRTASLSPAVWTSACTSRWDRITWATRVWVSSSWSGTQISQHPHTLGIRDMRSRRRCFQVLERSAPVHLTSLQAVLLLSSYCYPTMTGATKERILTIPYVHQTCRHLLQKTRQLPQYWRCSRTVSGRLRRAGHSSVH